MRNTSFANLVVALNLLNDWRVSAFGLREDETSALAEEPSLQFDLNASVRGFLGLAETANSGGRVHARRYCESVVFGMSGDCSLLGDRVNRVAIRLRFRLNWVDRAQYRWLIR